LGSEQAQQIYNETGSNAYLNSINADWRQKYEGGLTNPEKASLNALEIGNYNGPEQPELFYNALVQIQQQYAQ
ncbi:hypothetical protein, partial [Mammaliicoccus vitulinus]